MDTPILELASTLTSITSRFSATCLRMPAFPEEMKGLPDEVADHTGVYVYVRRSGTMQGMPETLGPDPRLGANEDVEAKDDDTRLSVPVYL